MCSHYRTSPNKKKVLIGYTVCLTLVVLTLLSVKQEIQSPIANNSVTAVYTGKRTSSLSQANSTLTAKERNGHHTGRETVKVPQTAEQRGYLVVLNFPEQLTAATDDLIQLYTFNQKHLKLRMIEPYVLGSHLKTVPPVSEDFRSLPLISAFLNRTAMLTILKRCFHSDHVDWHPFPDFLINAARQFVVVTFVTAKATMLNGNISTCSSNMEHIEYVLNYHLKKVSNRALSKHGVNYTFRGVHSLCVKAIPGEPFSMKDVVRFIRTWMTNTSHGTKEPFSPQFSVVIPEWRAVKNTEDLFYYYDPSYIGRNMTGSCQLRSLAHTPYVTEAAKSMFQRLSLSRPFIAVHVRSERISEQELKRHRTDFINSCISNFSKILQVVMKVHNISLENVVFVHDGSQHGSDSMGSQKSQKRSASNYIISRIKAIGIKNVQYKSQNSPNNVNSSATESALAQFVEKEFLVSADVLIALGYGGFQGSLIRRFKAKSSGGNNWYKLCSDYTKNDRLPVNISF